jgi:hypothetical protein
MKVRINEDQYKLLQNYQQRGNVDEYIKQMKSIISKINAYYSKLTFSSIADIISGEVNLSKIKDELLNLDSRLHKINQTAYDYINAIPDDEYEMGLDAEIDDAYSLVGNKIRKVEQLVEALESLPELEVKHRFSRFFDDIKPINQ